MSLFLRLIPDHLPDFLRVVILAELFKATAKGFHQPVPEMSHLSLEERLHAYALFTCQLAETSIAGGSELPALKTNLYQAAYPLGQKMRRWLGVKTTEEVMRLGQILYRAIGVEIQGDLPGQILVKRCYYSQFYSGPVCDLISALDEGIFSGLAGGRRLVFSQRLTEGGAFCRATLQVRSS